MHKAVNTKTGGSNAGYGATVVVYANVTSILHKTGLNVGLLPKITERGTLEFIEKSVIFGRKRERLGVEHGAPLRFICGNGNRDVRGRVSGAQNGQNLPA
jgi:hypothetical protein